MVEAGSDTNEILYMVSNTAFFVSLAFGFIVLIVTIVRLILAKGDKAKKTAAVKWFRTYFWPLFLVFLATGVIMLLRPM